MTAHQKGKEKRLAAAQPPLNAPSIYNAVRVMLNAVRHLIMQIPYFPKAPLIENGHTSLITLIMNKVIRGNDKDACPVLRELSKIRVYSPSAVNPDRDLMLVENAKPHGVPYPDRDKL